jgi:hypothetical protein
VTRPPRDELVLHAKLIPIARDITAKAGQRVIVVAGLVVGVYTGDEHVPLLEREEPQKAFAQVSIDPVRSASPTPPTRRPNTPFGSYRLKDGAPVRTIVPVMEAIRGVLSALPPNGQCMRPDLCAAAGIDVRSKHEWKIRAAISLLLENGEILKTNRGAYGSIYNAGPNLQRNIEQKDTPQ